MVFTAVLTGLVAAYNVTSIALLNPIGSEYFGVSPDQFTLGVTVNMVTLATAPLFLTPLSEVVSCRPCDGTCGTVRLTIQGWTKRHFPCLISHVSTPCFLVSSVLTIQNHAPLYSASDLKQLHRLADRPKLRRFPFMVNAVLTLKARNRFLLRQ